MRQNGTCPLEHLKGFKGNLHHTEMFSLSGRMTANVEQAASLLKVEVFYSKGEGSFIHNLNICVTNLVIYQKAMTLILTTMITSSLQQSHHCTH
jgi:hypothetical protein